MDRKMLKSGAMLAAGGMMLGFGGCMGDGFLGFVLRDAALNTAWEFVTDNDAVFDLFQDDFGTSTEYDDRFNFETGGDRTRVEPDGDVADNHQAIADAVG